MKKNETLISLKQLELREKMRGTTSVGDFHICRRLNMVISQTVTDRANITIVNTGCRLLTFEWCIYI